MNTFVRIRTDQRQELERALERYRETVLVSRYNYDLDARKHGILRRRMIDAILDNRPESRAEFMALLPERELAKTDPEQLRKEIEVICRLVRRH
jgi:hypothetical protein